MPLEKSQDKTYLSIGYGKLRKRTKVIGDGVVERKTQDGETTLAYEYKSIDGKITGIYYKESKDYGNSFEVTIQDSKETFGISFKEDSRYCQDFLSKLPNVNLDKSVKIAPYEFIDEKSGKQKRGVTVWQDEVKLDNFFQKKVGEEWIISHDYPAAEKNMSDKKLKIYFINVQEFLHDYTVEKIIPKLKEKSEYDNLSDMHNKIKENERAGSFSAPESDASATGQDDDLPF